MIKDLKNNFSIIKYVFKCCKLYPLWSILYIILETINAVLKVRVIAIAIEMVQNSFALDNPMDMFWDITNILIIYLVISCLLTIYLRLYSSFINGYYQTVYVNKLFEIMFNRVKDVDFADFDNPEFYDMYSRAMRTGVSAGMRAYRELVNFITSLAKIFALGAIIVISSTILIIIILASVLLRIIIGNKKNRNIFEFERDSELDRRMSGYVNILSTKICS